MFVVYVVAIIACFLLIDMILLSNLQCTVLEAITHEHTRTWSLVSVHRKQINNFSLGDVKIYYKLLVIGSKKTTLPTDDENVKPLQMPRTKAKVDEEGYVNKTATENKSSGMKTHFKKERAFNTSAESSTDTKNDTNEKWDRILSIPTIASSVWAYFNVTASDAQGNYREIYDSRPEGCINLTFNISNMPSTSVISIFHNEARSTLMRTIHSFLYRTPPELLKEMILVDDASTYSWLLKPLTDYVAHFPKIKLIRLSKRQGLIRARLKGAQEATGEVLYFTDSHTEANVQWLEPLLSRIMQDRKVLLIPVIDPIQSDTLQYFIPIRESHGAVTWKMKFVYKALPQHIQDKRKSDIDPIPSPVIVGCSHAIERKYFFETGSYDKDMEIWGGENIEHAFRLWMCGGRVEHIPCSRVGHVFKKYLTFSFRDGYYTTVARNFVRIAEVWMDDYKKYFYATQKSLPAIDLDTLAERKKLREKLKCHSFDWYMKNISPEIPIPPDTAKYYGEIKSVFKDKDCLHFDYINKKFAILICEKQDVSLQQLRIDRNGVFAYKNVTINSMSMFYSNQNISLPGKWTFTENKQISTMANGNNVCVKYVVENSTNHVILSKCDIHDQPQQWEFQYEFDFTHKWDIEEVVKAAVKPPDGAVYFGQLRNIGSGSCMDVYDEGYYDMVSCAGQPTYKAILHLNTDGYLMYQDKYLHIVNNKTLHISNDKISDSDNLWDYDKTTNTLKTRKSRVCLAYRNDSIILVERCTYTNTYEKWTFTKPLHRQTCGKSNKTC